MRVWVFVRVRVYVYVCIPVCAYVHVYVYMYVCIEAPLLSTNLPRTKYQAGIGGSIRREALNGSRVLGILSRGLGFTQFATRRFNFGDGAPELAPGTSGAEY